MTRPCVLVFSGSDPSGGAGIQADIQAITAHGAHPLSVITALTVQDNDQVFSVHPTSPQLVRQQTQVLIDKIVPAAIKIGIVGSRANADAIAALIQEMKSRRPDLPVVLDPVLASGHGNALSIDDALQTITPLIPLATLVTPNLPEAAAWCDGNRRADAQADVWLQLGCEHVLIKGGHSVDDVIINRWFADGIARSWHWPRLPGTFHGTGCTLAAAIAALLARGKSMAEALDTAQSYCNQALESSYAIGAGQQIPDRAWSTYVYP